MLQTTCIYIYLLEWDWILSITDVWNEPELTWGWGGGCAKAVMPGNGGKGFWREKVMQKLRSLEFLHIWKG